MSGDHIGPTLDFGWCVVRTVNEKQLRRVRCTDRFRRERVHIWMAAGLSPAKQKKLSAGSGLLNMIDRLLEPRKARVIAAMCTALGAVVTVAQIFSWIISRIWN